MKIPTTARSAAVIGFLTGAAAIPAWRLFEWLATEFLLRYVPLLDRLGVP